MSIVDKLTYIKLSGLTDGHVVLGMFTEDEVYEIYRSGLYNMMSLDGLFLVYVVILNNLKLNREGISETGNLVNHYNKHMYNFSTTNKVNVMDYGEECYQRFLTYLMSESVKQHKSTSIDAWVKSEVFKGSPFYEQSVPTQGNRGVRGKHEDLVITLLVTFRHYYGYDYTDRVGEEYFKAMVSTVISEFNQLDEGNPNMFYYSNIKLANIRNFIEHGQWAVESNHLIDGTNYKKTKYEAFTEVDKEVRDMEFKLVGGR